MPNKTNYLTALEVAIASNHNCKPAYRGTVFVAEKSADNEIVWETEVETFDLPGNQEAKSCYAWREGDPEGLVKIFTILENQSIDSPQKAVQSALSIDGQLPGNKGQENLQFIRQQLEECRAILKRIKIKVETSVESPSEVKIVYRNAA